MLAALLTGVNRAFPFVQGSANRKYFLKTPLCASLHAYMLCSLFYCHWFPGEIPSFEDHLQSLFKVVHIGPLATAIQSLVLLYQIMESRQAVSGRYYQALYTKLVDPRLSHSGKQVGSLWLHTCNMMQQSRDNCSVLCTVSYTFVLCVPQALFLNILFKSLKTDPEVKRVQAFLKRMLQVCSSHSPPFVCGCLYLISEVCRVWLNTCVKQITCK